MNFLSDKIEERKRAEIEFWCKTIKAALKDHAVQVINNLAQAMSGSS